MIYEDVDWIEENTVCDRCISIVWLPIYTYKIRRYTAKAHVRNLMTLIEILDGWWVEYNSNLFEAKEKDEVDQFPGYPFFLS